MTRSPQKLVAFLCCVWLVSCHNQNTAAFADTLETVLDSWSEQASSVDEVALQIDGTVTWIKRGSYVDDGSGNVKRGPNQDLAGPLKVQWVIRPWDRQWTSFSILSQLDPRGTSLRRSAVLKSFNGELASSKRISLQTKDDLPDTNQDAEESDKITYFLRGDRQYGLPSFYEVGAAALASRGFLYSEWFSRQPIENAEVRSQFQFTLAGTVKGENSESLFRIISQPISADITYSEEIHCETSGNHRIRYRAVGPPGRIHKECFYSYTGTDTTNFDLSMNWYDLFSEKDDAVAITIESNVKKLPNDHQWPASVDNFTVVPTAKSWVKELDTGTVYQYEATGGTPVQWWILIALALVGVIIGYRFWSARTSV